MSHYEQIAELILKRWNAEITPEEEAQLQEWINADPEHAAMLERFKDTNWVIQQLSRIENTPMERAKERLWGKHGVLKSVGKPRLKRKGAIRYILYGAAAVAAAICICFLLLHEYNGHAKEGESPGVARDDSTRAISPGADKAILHLADGSTYFIRDTLDGHVARMHNLICSKKNGMLVCERTHVAPQKESLVYHTFETLTGSMYGIVLPDGSKVWLNSGSRIRFPSAFIGNQRLVELEGEAYFDVAHNAEIPFIAIAGDAKIKVTGTEFNILAYPGDKHAKVTLVVGSVGVSSGNSYVNLSPAQSAVFAKGLKPTVVKEKNMNKILAWRNNQFLFENDSLTSVLKEIAQWYNLEVVYENRPTIVVSYFKDFRSRPVGELIKNLIARNRDLRIRLIDRTLFVG